LTNRKLILILLILILSSGVCLADNYVGGSPSVTNPQVSQATNDLTISGIVNTVPGSAVFARESNAITVTGVKNTGSAALNNIYVALYASDVSGSVPVNTTTIASIASGGTATLTMIDPTIRNLEGSTVTYTAVVDPENLIPETNEANNNKNSMAKAVKYNGYKGKRYWEGGSDITTKQTYDLQGNFLYFTQPESAYKSVGWTSRTETWTASNLPIPSGSTVEKVWLYLAYNWDTTSGGVPKWDASFNGHQLTGGTPYTDKSNFGGYAEYKYGLYVFDVTSQFKSAGNSLVMASNAGNSNALYPSTLVVIYRNSNETRKQIFINEECDELGLSAPSYGTTLEEATAYAPFTGMSVDLNKVASAKLYSFAGSAGPDEGNLLFNGNTIASNAWQGNPSTSSPLVFNVKNYIKATGNEAGIQGTTSGGMDSLQQILVVEYQKQQEAAPAAAFSASPTSGKAPLNVIFTDKSTGTPTKWQWNFGDGTTSTQQNPTHKYSKSEVYTVSLTVKNAKGSNTVTKTDYITVITKPVSNFTSSVTSGKAPLTVTFTDKSTGTPGVWKWSFGDGTTSTLKNPTHKYSKAGVYTVSLTVKNAVGSNTVTKTDYIKVVTKPVAAFSASPTSGKVPLTVTFTDKSAGTPTKWKWSFGDGTTSTQQNPKHKYSKAGKYTVTLTVTNAAGINTVTKTNYITVTANT
jgi:PKD repeat protein